MTVKSSMCWTEKETYLLTLTESHHLIKHPNHIVDGGLGFSKVVATFSHVGGSFNLLWLPLGMSE